MLYPFSQGNPLHIFYTLLLFFREETRKIFLFLDSRLRGNDDERAGITKRVEGITKKVEGITKKVEGMTKKYKEELNS